MTIVQFCLQVNFFQGAKNVIKNDFDKYAKAPIDKKFALTVELCEEIQIQRLFIGVNELFASRPSKFSVQAADKVKSEWHFLGVFNIEPSGKSNLLKEVTFFFVENHERNGICRTST